MMTGSGIGFGWESPRWKSQEVHDVDVAALAETLSGRQAGGAADDQDDVGPSFVCMGRKPNDSNTTRKPHYRKKCQPLNTLGLNAVIKVDTQNCTVACEPRVSMFELFAACLKSNLMPLVAPEFGGITVGGAIVGAALESSSFRWGQLNDCCVYYDVLLGDGRLVRCSRTENAQLFDALPGSYGTLGIVTLAVLRCEKAKKYVRVRYLRHHSASDAVDHLRESSRSSTLTFVEGCALARDDIVTMCGSLTDGDAPSDRGLQIFDMPRWKWWSKWFVFHVAGIARSLRGRQGDLGARGQGENNSDTFEELIPLSAYLVRWDRGAFWMALNPFQSQLLSRMFVVFAQLFIVRLLFGWFCTTRSLYRALHRQHESVYIKRLIVQDFYVPSSSAVSFVECVTDRLGIFPLWLCPVRGARGRDQFLSPNFLRPESSANEDNDLFVNVGVYGAPRKRPFDPHEVNSMLEKLVDDHGGRKMLYADMWYSREEFWSVYDREKYESLRQMYNVRPFMDLYDKLRRAEPPKAKEKTS